MDIVYTYKCRYDTQEKKFRYGIPTYTDPFQTLIALLYLQIALKVQH